MLIIIKNKTMRKNNVTIRFISVLLTFISFFSYGTDNTIFKVENCKNKQAVNFTMPELRVLESAEITTLLPWKKQEHRYLGVYLENIIRRVDGHGLEVIHVHAKNAYSVKITAAELQQHKYMLAYAIDDEAITRRHKGPLILMRDLSAVSIDDIHELNVVINLVWFVESIDINCGITH
jgi:hypothetical protein